MKPSNASKIIEHCMSRLQTVMLWGGPGVCKSALVQAASLKQGRYCDDSLRGSHILPEDLRLPELVQGKDGGAGYATWRICETLRAAQDSSMPYTLFVDEVSAAPTAVQAIFYQLAGDRRLPDGSGTPLRPGIAIVMAGNRMQDGAVSYHMSTALRNRMTHVDVEPDITDWAAWANANDVHPMVVAFNRWKPQLLYAFDKTQTAFPTPRSWEYVSNLLKDASLDPEVEHAMITGTVGQGAADEFIAYARLFRSLPDIPTLIANPKGAAVPSDPAVLYAVATALARHATVKTIAAIVTYLDRLPDEYAVLAMKDVWTRDESLNHTAAVSGWVMRHQDVLFG